MSGDSGSGALARSPLDLYPGDAGIHYLFGAGTNRVGYWFGGPGSKPVLFTAIQDQLGLKFENGTVDDQVVVVDHIERPTEN